MGKKKSKVDILSNEVMSKRRDLEKTIKALVNKDVTVGLGALEHCLIMLEALKRELRESGIDDSYSPSTLEGRIQEAKMRIEERPKWLKAQ